MSTQQNAPQGQRQPSAEQRQAMVVREETGRFAMTLQSPEYQAKFKSMLPSDIPTERFTNIILRAVQEDPDLMSPSVDKASLFLACQRAAQDGLLPDKREGALVKYGNKVQWQPMIGGLRKRVAAAGFDLRAEVVHENDVFDYDLGDDPRITHKAPPLGKERGKVIGAYAIATSTSTGDKYREVMDVSQLDAVKAVSRGGNGGPWAGPFKTEMQRKTVAKRLIKSLPIDDRRLRDIIDRDNEQFDLDRAKPEPSSAASQVQAAARSRPTAPESAQEPDAPIDGTFTEVQPDERPEPTDAGYVDPFA